MIDYTREAEFLTEQLKSQESSKEELKRQLSDAESKIVETQKCLGQAKANLAIDSNSEVSLKDLQLWFDRLSGGGPVPEEVLTKLLDIGQLAVVEEYVTEQYSNRDCYSKSFYLRLIREAKNFAKLTWHRSKFKAPKFFSAYLELFEEKVLSADFQTGQIRHIPPTDNEEVVLKLARAHHSNVESYCGDFSMLKKLVAVNPKVLNNVKSDVTGRVLKMRELVAVNPICAHFASSPIPNNAGVSTRDNPEARYTKILDWLRSTADKQAIKKVIPAAPSSAPVQKKTFKL